MYERIQKIINLVILYLTQEQKTFYILKYQAMGKDQSPNRMRMESLDIDYTNKKVSNIRQPFSTSKDDSEFNNNQITLSYNPFTPEAGQYGRTFHRGAQLCFMAFILCFSTFYFGFNLTCVAVISKPTLSQYFGIDSSKQENIGILNGLIPIGAAFGAIIAPILMRFLSRKKCLLLMNATAILIAGIIQINYIEMLITCRVIEGFIVGINMAIVPVYIFQITPKSLLGIFGVFTQFSVIFSLVVSFGFSQIFHSMQINGNFQWRFMFSFTGVTSLIQTILLLTVVPESPVSLLQKGDEEGARKVVSRYTTSRYVEQVFNDKKTQMATSNEQQFIKKQQVSKRSLFLGFQLPFMQQMTGINMLATQLTFIFSDFSVNTSVVSPLIANAIQLIATGLSILLLLRLGRRPLILFGNLGISLCDLSIGVCFLIQNLTDSKAALDVVLVFIIMYMIIFGLTIGPIIWLYVPEILPARMVPTATATNWFGCAFCVIVPNYIMIAAGSPYPVFFMFGLLTFINYIFNWLMVVQTKGMTRSVTLAKLK